MKNLYLTPAIIIVEFKVEEGFKNSVKPDKPDNPGKPWWDPDHPGHGPHGDNGENGYF